MAAYVFIDVSHKQEFIYKHNRLKDNLYNSFIIKSVTEKIEDFSQNSCYSGVSLSGYLATHHCRQFKFVYSGGGNSIVRFETADEARRFVRGYSGEILRAYPDLELYISLVDETEFATVDENIKEEKIREELHYRADQLKDKRRARFKRWTYGIEQVDETGQPIQRCTVAPDYNLSRKYLYKKLEKALKGTAITITNKMESYRKEEEGKGYIGVIVIDGNKMGEIVKRISKFGDLRKFSKTIESIYLKAVATALKSWKKPNNDCKQGTGAQPLYVTPVVMAGDDICLIIEAKYAIETAAEILKQIEKLSSYGKCQSFLGKFMGGNEKSLKACAGIAIVKYNYPFFEAFTTAEALCHRAKESMHKVKGKVNASFIDWDIVQGQVSAVYGYENYVKHGKYKEKYHIKPLRIDQGASIENGIYSYHSFIRLIDELTQFVKDEKDIGKSILEELKKVIYSGWEQYKLFFDMKQGGACQQLIEIVQKVYNNASTCCTAVLESKDEKSTVYTYVLNDVLDALPFTYRG